VFTAQDEHGSHVKLSTAVFVKFQPGESRVLGPSRLLGQRLCKTRVTPPMWAQGVSQTDIVSKLYAKWWMWILVHFAKTESLCLSALEKSMYRVH